MTLLAATGTQAMWYLTRGSGAVALILLTLSVVAGVADVRRLRTDQLPRFVVDALHRTVSMLAVAFVVVHVLTSVIDGFAPIGITSAVIPFVAVYRPIWLGLGAIAFDLMLAVMITSLLRQRIGHRVWRVIHWASYASWPVAVVHGLGSGSDAKGAWMLLITVACLLAVLAAALTRIVGGWPENREVRVAGLVACAAVPLFLVVWLPGGPLGKGWARRAGTPASLLHFGAPTSATAATGSASSGSGATAAGSGSAATATSSRTATSFTAPISGTVRQGLNGTGLAVVDITASVSGQQLNRLRIRLEGEPSAGGGVQMTSSRVTLGPAANPDQLHGVVTSLAGTEVQAIVRDSSGTSVLLDAALQVPQGSGPVSGTLRATPRAG